MKYLREVSSGTGARTCEKPGFTIPGKNEEEQMTGNKHQVPSDSMKGQKRTAKNRYKLPVGL
jgi:hypothetical protein